MSAKPAYTHSIVEVKAGEVIPETFLRKLCSEHGSCVGLVVREPNKLEVEKFHEMGDAAERFTLLNGVNLGTKKYLRQFVFGAFPEEFDEDECQPWVVLKDSKGNPLLTVSCEGDFPVTTSKEGESEAYVVMHTDLGPKIEAMYQLCGNNPQKLFDYIRSAQFTADVNKIYAFRGAFALMPTIGDSIMLGNFREEGKGGADYEWGTASFNHGYTDPVIEAATAEAAPVPVKAKPRSKYAEEPEAEPKPSVPAVPLKTEPETDPIKKAADAIGDTVNWSPPKNLHGKALKKAYRDMLGELPDNWQNRPSFKLKAKDSVSSLKELDQTTAKQNAQPKDMREPAPTVILPVIDGKMQEKAVNMIKKYLGDGSALIKDPLEAQRQEANIPEFSELFLKSGDLKEVRAWPRSFRLAFIKENPEAAEAWIAQLQRDAINRESAVKDGDKTLGELTESTITPVPDSKPSTPLKVEPPAPEPRRSKYA